MQCLSTPTYSPITAALTALLLLLATATPALAWVDPTTTAPYASQVLAPAKIPLRNWQPGHRGLDLAAEPGDTIYAAGDGTVHFAGTVAGTPVLSIHHPEGFRTTYQPVRTTLKEGDEVTEGDAIGTLAFTPPNAPNAHVGLHWGALRGKDGYFDPLTLLDPPQIRLKPLDS
ncbi:M23 family metallopeptidase [Corynebacterium imitans]|uniref:M23 family metallopeptidase n=1 Tax=Corynebacterium imitans TaxID=156978 RepID=UPI001EF335DB|nr:M23 family metallopeptidase [Corynebacterium imitans]MCG7277686.1 M23 family metallopeptidase [Corynebacterium imitans]